MNLHSKIKRLNRKAVRYSTSTEIYNRIIGKFIERGHYLF
ncbi:IS1 family transposase [Yersinia alsatica]